MTHGSVTHAVSHKGETETESENGECKVGGEVWKYFVPEFSPKCTISKKKL